MRAMLTCERKDENDACSHAGEEYILVGGYYETHFECLVKYSTVDFDTK